MTSIIKAKNAVRRKYRKERWIQGIYTEGNAIYLIIKETDQFKERRDSVPWTTRDILAGRVFDLFIDNWSHPKW